jgi:hypothetical protein
VFVLLQRKRNLRRKTSLEIYFFVNRKSRFIRIMAITFAARPDASKTYFLWCPGYYNRRNHGRFTGSCISFQDKKSCRYQFQLKNMHFWKNILLVCGTKGIYFLKAIKQEVHLTYFIQSKGFNIKTNGHFQFQFRYYFHL